MSEIKTIKILCVRMDEELYNQLRKVAFKRTGRLHGAVSMAVREALLDYIRKYEGKDVAQNL
jgi:predicted DNA-binding protein